MSQLFAYLKDSLRLGSLLFMLAVFAIGTLLLFSKRTIAWGRRWLVGVLLGYWVLSLPLGAMALSWPLTHKYDHRLASAAESGGAQAVVILGGGTMSYVANGVGVDDLATSALRVDEGVRLYRVLGAPLLIMSGGNTQRLDPPRSEAQAFRAAAINLGVPADRIVVEERSMTTREQVEQVKDILSARGIDRFVVVTTPTHMSRSLAIFRAAGLAPVPSASILRSEQDKTVWTLMPDRKALTLSDAAIYEYFAWIYYLGRGWI